MFQGEGPGGGRSGRQGRQLGGCRRAGPGRDDGDSDESDAEGSRAEFGTCRGRTLWKWEVVRGRALREGQATEAVSLAGDEALAGWGGRTPAWGEAEGGEELVTTHSARRWGGL